MINSPNIRNKPHQEKLIMITSAINKNLLSIENCQSILAKMRENGLTPNEVTYTSIINKHCKTQEDALRFLDEMKENGLTPDEVTYTSIINKHCKTIEDALSFLDKMRDNGLTPNEVTYSSILNKVDSKEECSFKGLKELYEKINLKPKYENNMFDFHGALEGVSRFFFFTELQEVIEKQHDKEITLITGKGIHSMDKIPRLKNMLIELIKKEGLHLIPNENEGRIIFNKTLSV